MNPTAIPLRHLRGGADIPALGFGTWELRAETTRAVRHALDTGYRHIDTAAAYNNEAMVGRAIIESGVPRQQCWITTKIWRDDLTPAGVRRQAEASLRELASGYIDLLLIHWPNEDFELAATLDALRQLASDGIIRFFGVSNFTLSQWREAIRLAPEIITNQVEYHPLLAQQELLDAAACHQACLTAYSPLARGLPFTAGHPASRVLEEIAANHAKTPQQIVLRWLIEQPAVVAIPGSRNPLHIASNFDIFDFTLAPGEAEIIANLACGHRLVAPAWGPPEWTSAS